MIGIRDTRGRTGQDLTLEEMEVALSLPAEGRAPAARFNSGPALIYGKRWSMEYDENMMIGCTNRELAFFCPHCKTHIRIIVEPNTVKCKDCKWRGHEDDSPKWIPCLAINTNNDWYCADWERK